MARMREWIKQNSTVISVAALSIAFFIFLYGIRVLDVTNTEWLMAGGDLSQHYLGWQFFRFAPWQIQIGMMNTIAYPYSESIIFTDSIPLFCILFKLMRRILPEEFQFFGLWGVFCFVMQGILAVRILGNYLKRKSETLIGAVFFLLTPVFVQRMFWHSALAAHFLILLAILFFVEEEKITSPVKSALCWGALGALVSAVHLYFLAMCGAVLFGFVIKKFLKKEWWTGAVGLLSYLLTAAAVIWMLGGFSSGMDDGAPGLGYYSFNLNGFFHADGWSSILPELPYYADGQYEGFAYLGFGILCLAAIALLIQAKQRMPVTVTAVIAAFVSVILVAASASNEVSFGSRLLFRIPLPGWVEELWAPFRSSGRLIWPVIYFIMIYAVCGGRKIRKKYLWSIVLSVCLFIQLADIGSKLWEKHDEFRMDQSYQESVDTGTLAGICADRPIRHLVFMEKEKLSQEDLYTFSDFAWKNEITINDFYFARYLDSPIDEVARDFAAHPSDDCIYLFGEEARMSLASYDLHYYRVGGFYAGVKEAVDGMHEVEPEEEADFAYLFNGENVEDGWDEAGVRYLSPGGCSFGPFLDLPAGEYSVIIEGEHLLESSLESYSSGGFEIHEAENLYVGDTLITYDLFLPEDVQDYEIKLTNLSADIMKISAVSIRK